MKDRTLTRKADDAAEWLTRIANTLNTCDDRGDTVLDRIRHARADGLKAQRFDSPIISGGDSVLDEDGHPVSIADRHIEAHLDQQGRWKPDSADRDLQRITSIVVRLHTDTMTLVDILSRWQARPANKYERSTLDHDNDPGCQSCSRITNNQGAPVYSPPVTDKPTTVGGNLAEPMWLCRWCRDFVQSTGRLPSLNQCRDHEAGIKVRHHAEPKRGAA